MPEQTFWEGAPSITETLVPGLSVFTVVGVIPFAASIARQAWTKYKFTNRRIEVASGFQGKDVVQVLWREITDIKWLRRASDIPTLARTQSALLDALWPLLAPGGRLLYATCSILTAENADVIDAFLARQGAARAEAIDARWGEAAGAGRRIAPGGAWDGFYYALLRKP